MDQADITSMNDFSEESVRKKLMNNQNTKPSLPRGICASCKEKVADNAIYCDADCREEHERVELFRKRTGR